MNKTAFFFKGDQLLMPEETPDSQIGELPIELAKEFKNPDIFEIQAIDAGDSQETISVVSLPQDAALPKNWKSILVRHAISVIDYDPGRLFRACHIAQWKKESSYCGSCGSKNMEMGLSLERKCPACGRIEFPRICPAIITAIVDEQDRILLAHNKKFRAGLYSLISGFNEAGESLEETVVREVKEEVNIEVKDIFYIKSQPWPFPNSLMLGFRARFLGGTVKPDGIEIEDARWFSRDNLPELPGKGSLSRFLIESWFNKTLF